MTSFFDTVILPHQIGAGRRKDKMMNIDAMILIASPSGRTERIMYDVTTHQDEQLTMTISLITFGAIIAVRDAEDNALLFLDEADTQDEAHNLGIAWITRREDMQYDESFDVEPDELDEYDDHIAQDLAFNGTDSVYY